MKDTYVYTVWLSTRQKQNETGMSPLGTYHYHDHHHQRRKMKEGYGTPLRPVIMLQTNGLHIQVSSNSFYGKSSSFLTLAKVSVIKSIGNPGQTHSIQHSKFM